MSPGSFPGTSTDGRTPWQTFINPQGATYDGRYIYLLPNSPTNGAIARYDSQSNFTSYSSWQGVDLASFSGLATDGITPWSSFFGFGGGVFDGRYLYLVPAGGSIAKAARYDTQLKFESTSSWRGVDVAAFSGMATDGVTPWSSFGTFKGSAFDGRYIYYVPSNNGKALRYDTTSIFELRSSWEGTNLNAFSGTMTDGNPWSTATNFWGATYDGRFVYMTTLGTQGTLV